MTARRVWADQSQTNEESEDGEEFNPEEEEEEWGGRGGGAWGRGRVATRVGSLETRALHAVRLLMKL